MFTAGQNTPKSVILWAVLWCLKGHTVPEHFTKSLFTSAVLLPGEGLD